MEAEGRSTEEHLSASSWAGLAQLLLLEVAETPAQVQIIRHYGPDLQEPTRKDRRLALKVILAAISPDPDSGFGEGAMT